MRPSARSRAAGWLSRVNAILAAAWLGMVAAHLGPVLPGLQAERPDPDAVVAPVSGAPAEHHPPDVGREAWARPLGGGSRVSSPFGPRDGRMHHGVDLAAPPGTPVHAVLAGTVRRAGWRGAYGLAVEIEHKDGWRTLYAHLAEIRVTPGQRVDKGAVIGVVGATGNATGPHLHLEVRRGRTWYDPLRYLKRATTGSGAPAAAGGHAGTSPGAPAGAGARGGS
ncbi:MAG TPA: M23 family metallopeptidase [Thermaerobacter sp.]